MGNKKDIAEKIKAELAALEKELWANRIYHFCEGDIWRPNPLQVQLIDAWNDPRNKVFSACGANRIGKCHTYRTLIDTPDGEVSVGSLFEIGKPFDVYAWDGKRKVIAKASPPFKKAGLHKCYRITMSDGRWFEPADFHRVLTTSGWHTAHQIYLFWQNLQESNLDISLSVRDEGVLNFSQIPLDYQDGCFVDHDLCGVQPLLDRDSGQVFSPSRDGVQLQDSFYDNLGVPAYKCASIRQRVYDLLSILDDLRQSGGQFAESLSHSFYRFLTQFDVDNQFAYQSNHGSFHQPQPNAEFFQQASQSLHKRSPSLPPSNFSGVNSIESIIPISTCQEVYDFEVKKYHNYFAGGLIHHNTLIGVVIGLSVMFGEWPWSGEKIPFIHKDPRKVRYVGQGWESHVKTVVEPELKKMWPQCRAVETKKNNQGVEALWKDKATGSTLEIMSNNQESDTFEGWSGDLIIWDEPPKRSNRIAAARGLVDREGRELFVATLLKEAWIHREIIKKRLEDGSPDPSVFNVNADISVNVGYGLTQEGVDQFVKTLRKDEVEARIKGKPSYLGTLVLPNFDRDKHVIDRFKIPLDWVTDVSIDFHPSKAWAVLFVSTGKNNFKYASYMISEKGNPKYIAEEIVRIAKTNDLFINSITIDPLAKGDQNAHEGAETVYKIMERVFKSYNYRLDTASKDKDNGISLLNDLLMTENEMPALFFFRDLGLVIEEVEDWMYDPETLRPSKVKDDFCEVLYRIALKNTQWKDPYDRYSRMNKLPQADMGEIAFG